MGIMGLSESSRDPKTFHKDGKTSTASHRPPHPYASAVNKRSEPQNWARKRKIEDYQQYAAIVLDPDGNWYQLSSPLLKRHKRFILADAVVRAQECINGANRSPEDCEKSPTQSSPKPVAASTVYPQPGSITYPFQSKRPRVDSDASGLHLERHMGSIQQKSAIVRDPKHSRTLPAKKELAFPTRLKAIRLDERSSWEKWFLDGFTSIQQTACRTIAKEWIKAVHPKKQSTHPYNGKTPRNEGGSPDPERTRPPYWPANVRHKEPDHIDKANRTALLVHLLMHTPLDEIVPENVKSERSFTAQDLLAALQKKQDDGILAKWQILQELVTARESLENYEAGGADGDAVLHVPDWSEIVRAPGAKRKDLSVPSMTEDDATDITQEMEDTVSVDEHCENNHGDDAHDHSMQEADYVESKSEPASTSFSVPSLRRSINSETSLTVPERSATNQFPNSSHALSQPITSQLSHNPSMSHGTEAYGAPCRHGDLEVAPGSVAPESVSLEDWHTHAPNQMSMIPTYDNVLTFQQPIHVMDVSAFNNAHTVGQAAVRNVMSGANPLPMTADYHNYAFNASRSLEASYDFDHFGQSHRSDFNPLYGMSGGRYQK